MSGKEAEAAQTGGTSDPFLGSPPQYEGHCYGAQPAYVVQGQPGPHQGYVIQPPPPYAQTVQYNTQQGPVVNVMTARQPPNDYLVPAVLVTLFCFFPTGIIAIMRASDARSAAMYGDIQTAERHAKSAKHMIKFSLIAGIISTVLLVTLIIVYMLVIHHLTTNRAFED